MLINLESIQKSKSILMGFAILWIISFHYEFLSSTPLSYLFRIGYFGVDIFILLSSFGLCFSLSKNQNYRYFIRRRILRIIPTWWFLMSVLLIINTLINRNTPSNLFQLICCYSGLGWWVFHNEPFGIYYYEWFIPTLLVFYCVAPFLYKLNKIKLVTLWVLSIIFVYLIAYFDIDQRLSLTYLRFPTFIYGVILYKILNNNFDSRLSSKYLLFSSLFGTLYCILSISFNHETRFLGFMLAMPLILSLLSMILRGYLKLILSFIGALTLEIYLLHMYEIPLIPVMKVVENKTLAIIVTTIIVIFLSYCVNYVIRMFINMFKRKL